MNTPLRRRMAGVLALTALSGLTACSGGPDAQANEITMMVPLFGGAAAPSPTGELQQAVEKFLGKKLRITWVANADYNTKTNALLASDNLPDVVTIQDNKAPAFVKAAEAGAFWDLTGKLDKYPNLKPASAQTALNASVNGKTYGIYRVRPLLRSAVLIRKDWLDKLGLQLPKTTDDLYNVAKAFTEKDPDGNGKKDTYGLILPKWPGVTFAASSPYNAVDVWFGAPNNWGKRDGKLVPEFDTPEFMQANNYLKKLIDEGLTNPDWATLDTGKWNDPFVLGKGGIIIDVNVRATDLFKRFRELDPEHYTDKVAMTGNLTGPGGVKHSLPFTGYNGILAISKQRVRTEQQLDDLLKVMDKLASKEGSVLTTNGLEGRNIKVAGGFAEPVNQDDAKVKTIQSDVDNAFVQLGTRYTVGLGVYPAKPPSQAEQDNLKLRDELMNEDLKTAVIDPSLPVIAPTQVSKGATLNPIVLDARMNYLAGKLTEDQLKAEVKRWYDGGGTQIAAEIGQQLSKMGQ